LLACAALGREGTGLELSPQWAGIARQRLAGDLLAQTQTVVVGDARDELDKLPADHFHFVVTSPPYWSILGKKAGLKAQQERLDRGLDTKYSEDPADLGNIADYDEFLAALEAVWGRCARVLKPQRYMAVIVSDFRHGPRFYLYHADIARSLERVGLPLKGITILVQDNKNLYPFGVPRTFVSNVHHQYILIHQRPAE
jgi:DNA modification methylase